MKLHPIKYDKENLLSESLQYMQQVAQATLALQEIPNVKYEYNQRKLVAKTGKLRLYHYQPKIKNPNRIPVLVVFATVNRPEILDLFPETSFIGGLLREGLDVYLLDWGYPTLKDKNTTLTTYTSDYLHYCVKFIAQRSPDQKINLLGICQGGLICLCYTALYPYIKNLVLISTPIDFHTDDNLVAKFLNQVDLEGYAKVFGNISGIWLTQFFISLRPFELVGKKYLRFVDNINNKELTKRFLRVEKWLNDAPDQAGVAFTELANEFYKKNKLIKGQVILDDKKIDLSQLSVPILNVMASQDEIVPMSSSKVLKQYVSSKEYSEAIFPSGHIGIYVSDKVGNRMSAEIANWLKKFSD